MSSKNVMRALLALGFAALAAALALRPGPATADGPRPSRQALEIETLGTIDVESWSWGASRGPTPPGGTGGAPVLHEIVVTKALDDASPALFRAFCQGRSMPRAKLFVRKQGTEQHDYMVIELENVLISSLNIGSQGSENGTSHTPGSLREAGGGNGRPMESLSINYTKIEFHYVPQRQQAGIDCSSGACACMP